MQDSFQSSVRRPRPIDLRDLAQYELICELDMREPGDFLRRYMFRFNLGSLAFFLFALVTVAMFIAELTNPAYTGESTLTQLVLALIGSVVVVPIHEGIHALTYKAIGAPAVKFMAEWRKGLIYTVADRFVVNQREYVWLAIMPVLVISAALGGLYFVAPEYDLFIAGLLCFHTVSCVGDIAIVNFLWEHRERVIFSYDDCKLHRSYFYARRDTSS
ncbi:MAG: DUF3267 domain-containing protein [Anaerolineae bacterium]|nr:DUF3267 domain-containing protein [Thermoflexales bacterium]MDW8406210.1 DUF3267 domain-containing protein [Anaerolineae bacterium]